MFKQVPGIVSVANPPRCVNVKIQKVIISTSFSLVVLNLPPIAATFFNGVIRIGEISFVNSEVIVMWRRSKRRPYKKLLLNSLFHSTLCVLEDGNVARH